MKVQKDFRGHSLPPRKDILTESINLFNQYHCTKLFLISEDFMYLNIFKRYFKNDFLNVQDLILNFTTIIMSIFQIITEKSQIFVR